MPPSLVRIDATEPLEKILDVIERDGGVIVTNFLSQELLKESMDTSEFGMWHHLIYTNIHQSSLASPAANYTTPRPHTTNSVQISFPRAPNESM
jgi:hypothetical protein